MRGKRWISLLAVLILVLGIPMQGFAAKKPSIKLGFKLGLIYEGGSAQLSPRLSGVQKSAVRFVSSDDQVVSVTAGGVVQALKAGRAIVTVTGGGAQAQCGVVVLPRSIIVAEGADYALPNGTLEQYRMKDTDIAEVDLSGVVTGRQAGNTLLAVKYQKQILLVEVHVVEEGTVMSESVTTTAPEVSEEVTALESAGSDQVVLVEYISGSNATLSVHDRINGTWVERLSTSAYVGKNGIGKTKEGDKKTPVGVYNLNTPFGIKADPGAKMPYTQVTKYHYWCGSSSSKYYNQLVDSRVTGRSYTSSDEHLIDYKGVYNYCMFIDYNAQGQAGKGSCIFLHCKGSNPYTAGCVAVDEGVMKQIIQWARPGVKIVIQ